MFYAAADRGDRSNQRAQEVISAGERLLTSDHVLVESSFLIAHRLGRDAAERFWGAIRAGAVSVEAVIAADLDVAFGIGEDFPDQDFSIVDRTSFAVMQRLGVFRAASLDGHFAIFRFGKNRSRAFEIVR